MDKYQWTCTGMATSDSANGPMRYIREIDCDALQAKVDELTKTIIDFRDGNYPHPRNYRPNNCPHGTHYWDECANCDEEYWQAALKENE